MAEFGEGAGGTFTLVDTAKFDPAKTTLREYLELYLEESGVGREPYNTTFGLDKNAKAGTKAHVFAKYLDRPMIHLFIDGQDDEVFFEDKNGNVVDIDPADIDSVKHGNTYKGQKIYATSPNVLIALKRRAVKKGDVSVAEWSKVNGIEENIDNWIKQKNKGNPIEVARKTGEISKYGGDAGGWKVTDLVTRPDKGGGYSAKYGYNPLKMGQWFEALTEHVKLNSADKNTALALMALAHSGLRPGQIENMAEFHLTGLEKDEIPTIFQPDNIEGGKMKVPLNIPVGERLRMIFNQAIKNNNDRAESTGKNSFNDGTIMFRHDDGSRVTTEDMTKLIKKIKVAGIKSDLGNGTQLDFFNSAYDLRRMHATSGALEIGLPQQIAALIRGRAIDAIAGSENIYIRAGIGYAGAATRKAVSQMDGFYWGKVQEVFGRKGINIPEGNVLRPESNLIAWALGDKSGLIIAPPEDTIEIDIYKPIPKQKENIIERKGPDDFDDPPAGGAATGEKQPSGFAPIDPDADDPDDGFFKKITENPAVRKIGTALSRGFFFTGLTMGIAATAQAARTPAKKYEQGIFGKTGRVIYEGLSTVLPFDPTWGVAGGMFFKTKDEADYEKTVTDHYRNQSMQKAQEILNDTDGVYSDKHKELVKNMYFMNPINQGKPTGISVINPETGKEMTGNF